MLLGPLATAAVGEPPTQPRSPRCARPRLHDIGTAFRRCRAVAGRADRAGDRRAAPPRRRQRSAQLHAAGADRRAETAARRDRRRPGVASAPARHFGGNARACRRSESRARSETARRRAFHAGAQRRNRSVRARSGTVAVSLSAVADARSRRVRCAVPARPAGAARCRSGFARRGSAQAAAGQRSDARDAGVGATLDPGAQSRAARRRLVCRARRGLVARADARGRLRSCRAARCHRRAERCVRRLAGRPRRIWKSAGRATSPSSSARAHAPKPSGSARSARSAS